MWDFVFLLMEMLGRVPLGFAALYPRLHGCSEKHVDTGWPWAIASQAMPCHQASCLCVVAHRIGDYAASRLIAIFRAVSGAELVVINLVPLRNVR